MWQAILKYIRLKTKDSNKTMIELWQIIIGHNNQDNRHTCPIFAISVAVCQLLLPTSNLSTTPYSQLSSVNWKQNQS